VNALDRLHIVRGEMQSMSENDFECLASTGVNTPETMSSSLLCAACSGRCLMVANNGNPAFSDRSTHDKGSENSATYEEPSWGTIVAQGIMQ